MFDTSEQTRLRMQSLKDGALGLYEDYVQNMEFNNEKWTGTLVPAGTHVMAGGLFTSLYNNEKPNDVDIFIFSKDRSTLYRVISDHQKAGFDNITHSSHYAKYDSMRIHTIFEKEISGIEYQIMVMSLGNSPEDLIETFDYVHSCIFYNPHDNTIQTFPNVLEVLERKILIENPLRDGNLIRPDKRRRKFLDRGWRDTTYVETEELGLSVP